MLDTYKQYVHIIRTVFNITKTNTDIKIFKTEQNAQPAWTLDKAIITAHTHAFYK